MSRKLKKKHDREIVERDTLDRGAFTTSAKVTKCGPAFVLPPFEPILRKSDEKGKKTGEITSKSVVFTLSVLRLQLQYCI